VCCDDFDGRPSMVHRMKSGYLDQKLHDDRLNIDEYEYNNVIVKAICHYGDFHSA
jgi:hypothetical protein